MAVGDVHRVVGSHVAFTVTEDATYGLVLTSIENLDDGTTQSFVARSLFEVVLRKVQQADEYFTLTADLATDVMVHGQEYSGDPISLGRLLVGESPYRGLRRFFHADFVFENVNGSGDDLTVHVYLNILDDEPDRVLCSLILDQTNRTGSQTMFVYSFFWAAPIVLAITPYTSDHYINGCNAGTVTRDPQTDLVGNGSTYQFNVGKNRDSAAASLYPATGFEPELQPTQFADEMDLMYPTWMAMALSGYGNRATAGQTVYIHDELRFRPRRFQDTFDSTNIILKSSVLVENPLVAGNGWVDSNVWRADTYVAVLKRTGDVLGEDIGLHYRRWALSSPNGVAIIPAKAKDRTDNGPEISRSPIFRPYFQDDDNGETLVTEVIAEEFRIALPELADVAAHPLYRMNYDLLYEYNNTHSGTMPDKVGNTVADLFAVAPDSEKADYAETLGEEYGLWTYGATVVRSPTTNDGRGLFAAGNFTDQRIRNHAEALDPSYPSCDDVQKFPRTITAVTYSAGFTKLTLDGAGFNAEYLKIYSQYAMTTAGIDHSTHTQHLGYIKKGTDYAFTIEKQHTAQFTATPPSIYIAEDQTATIMPGDAIDVLLVQQQYVPGYNGTGGYPDGTAMCSMADDIANPGVGAGWATQYIADVITYTRPWLRGILHVLPRHHQICFHNHGNETPGSEDQINGWRAILAGLRNEVLADNAEPFQIWEEDGPYDWLLGRVDSHTRTSIRCDMTSGLGSWGSSPLFQTVWGAFYRFGGQTGDRNGHITNYGGLAIYNTEFVGTPSLKWREAMVGDFARGRLPSFGVSPVVANYLGYRPDGTPAYTPFYHETEPMTVSYSMGALLARLAQVNIAFDMISVLGQRVRSFKRVGTSGVARNLVSSDIGHNEVYNIGIDEGGTTRDPLTHFVMRDHRNPRRMYAIFINPGLTTRGVGYYFDPALYADDIPFAGQSCKLTKYVVNHDGVVAEGSTMFRGAGRIHVALGAAEVVVYEITWTALKFVYRYDDDDFESVDMVTDQERQRLAPLDGQGARYQFGFESEINEEPFKIAAVQMRAFLLGRSSTI